MNDEKIYSREEVKNLFLDWRGISIEGGDVICDGCDGSGVMMYSNTSTWRHKTSGQMMTSDVCEKCWGSGVSNRKWTDLRKLL